MFVLMVVTACSSPEHYLLKGSLEGAGDDVIYLKLRLEGQLVKMDSCNIENGRFEFKPADVEYPQLYYLSIDGVRANVAFFLENSEIVVSGHADTLHRVRITGSASNDEYVAYNREIAPLYKKNSELFEQYRKAKEDGKITLAEEINVSREKIFEDLKIYQRDYIKSNPGSWITPTILRSISYSMEEDELHEILNGLDDALISTSAVKEMNLRLEALQKVRVGEMAPDFEQSNPTDSIIRFADIEGYKLLLIDFWAAWCGPCRKENPKLVQIYNTYKGHGFDMLGVSLDHNKEEWLKAIKDDKLSWVQVSDLKHWENEVAKLYCIGSIPNNILIDDNGIIIAKNLSGEGLSAKLKELFTE